MKKNINGKNYNTDNSEIIEACTENRRSGWFAENLRKTPKGDYFLHGRGGESTRWNGGEGIVTISKEQAKFWLKRAGLEIKL